MDMMYINELSVYTTLGIFSYEKQRKQRVIFDLAYPLATSRIALAGDLSDAVDYSQLAAALTEFVASRAFSLLEVLAEECAFFLQNECALSHFTLKITKLHCVSNAKSVTLIIER